MEIFYKECVMANDGQEQEFSGYRYLVDTSNSRQYAVRFQNGRPRQPIHVCAPKAEECGFKPNETLFALDDEVQFTQTSKGATASAMLFQIVTSADGKPKTLKMMGVDYDVKIAVNTKGIQVQYQLCQESAQALAERGFSAQAPKTFTNEVDLMNPGVQRTATGVTIDNNFLANLPFPPNHSGGALIARMASDTAMPAPAAASAKPAPSPYSKADDQTLEHVKALSGGKLKTVFDFEARRVTEIYEAPSKSAPGMTGHSFAEHDREALEQAYAKLVEIKGNPKPLDAKKAPGLKADKK
jgi:hypothetical protein